MELKLAGKTWRAIGRELNRTAGAVFKAVDNLLREMDQEKREILRAIENERLDRMHEAIWERVVAGEDDAIEIAVKISARRARMNGLDAPAVHELSGPGGGPLEVAEADATRQKLVDRIARVSGRDDSTRDH